MLLIIGLAVTTVAGFVAGLVTFKAKQRWCPHCGRTLSCALCSDP